MVVEIPRAGRRGCRPVGSARGALDAGRRRRAMPAPRPGRRDLGRRPHARRRGSGTPRRDLPDARRRRGRARGRGHTCRRRPAVRSRFGAPHIPGVGLGRMAVGEPAGRPGPGPRRAVRLRARRTDPRRHARVARGRLGSPGLLRVRHDDTHRPGNLGSGPRSGRRRTDGGRPRRRAGACGGRRRPAPRPPPVRRQPTT